MEALGTADPIFLDGLIEQLGNASFQAEQVNERGLNFLLSVVKGIKPRDQLEAMLAAQMAAVHAATMKLVRRLANSENIPQQDSAERAFNKLARTFAIQLEALKRYRSSGEQKILVQRVSVSEGGQAIVGNVTHAAPAAIPATAPAPALTHSQEQPMPLMDEGERAAAPAGNLLEDRPRPPKK